MSWRATLPLGLAALLAVFLGTDVLPWVRGPENWRWGYRPLPSPVGLLAVAAAIVATLSAVVGFSRATGRPARAGFLGLVVVALFAQMVLLTAVEPGGLSNVARRVMDPSFTSYHTIARDVTDPRDFLSRYHRLQPRFPVHGPSQPPGRVLFFWSVNRFVESSGTTRHLLDWGESLGEVPRGLSGTTETHRAGAVLAGFLLLFAGALCVVPLLGILEGRGVRSWALALMVTLPSFLLFTPQTDHLILLTSLTAAASLSQAIRRRESRASFAWCALGGLAAGLGVFLSFTALAALVAWGIALSLGLVFLVRRGENLPIPWALAAGATAMVSFLVVPLWAQAAGMDWVAVFRAATQAAERVQKLVHGRVYSTWVIWNLWDFAMFVGLPLTFVWLTRLREEFREIVLRDSALLAPWGAALLISLVGLDVSGRILGETGRIWMFLMPLAVLAVAESAARASVATKRSLGALVAAQGIVVLSLRLFLNVPG